MRWQSKGLQIRLMIQVGWIVQWLCYQQADLQYNFCFVKKQFQIPLMSSSKFNKSLSSYLEISEFIVKEHSPLIRPSSPSLAVLSETLDLLPTPEIAPIDQDTTSFSMTPIIVGQPFLEFKDIMEEFVLDSDQSRLSREKFESKKRKNNTSKATEHFSFSLFGLNYDLEQIIEHDQQSSDGNSNSFIDSEEEDDGSASEKSFIKSSSYNTTWSIKKYSKDMSCKDTEEQKLSTMDFSIPNYNQAIERFHKNPQNQINKKLKEIEASPDQDESQKRLTIKKYLEKYILEHQMHCYQQSWKELNLALKNTINIILEGVKETFEKKIGNLNFSARRIKLLKYLEKKQKRIWRKKVSYDCRKKVADGRLRIKGKFVTREQACEQLGLESLDNFSPEQIKDMLQRRMDQSLLFY